MMSEIEEIETREESLRNELASIPSNSGEITRIVLKGFLAALGLPALLYLTDFSYGYGFFIFYRSVFLITAVGIAFVVLGMCHYRIKELEHERFCCKFDLRRLKEKRLALTDKLNLP